MWESANIHSPRFFVLLFFNSEKKRNQKHSAITWFVVPRLITAQSLTAAANHSLLYRFEFKMETENCSKMKQCNMKNEESNSMIQCLLIVIIVNVIINHFRLLSNRILNVLFFLKLKKSSFMSHWTNRTSIEFLGTVFNLITNTIFFG